MGNEDEQKNNKISEQSALLTKPSALLTAQQRSDLMDAALASLEKALKERRHPYRIRTRKSEDNTRSVVRLARGRLIFLLYAFFAGLCVLTVLCQRFINPWYKWVFLLEVSPHGRIGIKFSIARNLVTYILTCILGSCILALFSHCEHKEIKRSIMESLQDTADEFFAEQGLGVAPEVVNLRRFRGKDGDDDDGDDEEEDDEAFLNGASSKGDVADVDSSTYGSV